MILLSLGIELLAQDNDTEYWRDLAYQAKLNGDIETSLNNYKKILELDSSDYDAKLAIANLYYSQKNYQESLDYYNLIYQVDQQDVEALNGFGRCYYKLDQLDNSIFYFKKAIEYLPSYLQQYFDLAHIYTEKGELDSARIVYEQILEKDSTYAEAWAGIGKMYYWKNLPQTSLKYYMEALKLDPENEEIEKEFQQVSNELAYMPYATFLYINEVESTYEINAITQKYGLNKRISDHFSFSFNFLLDKSNRVYIDESADTNRWYDNTYIMASWISSKNKVSAFAGASVSDSRLTSYGLNWISNFNISKIKFKNNLTFGYDYFYYWNEIGKNFISNTLVAKYGKFSLDLSGMYGVITENIIADYYADKYDMDVNPHRGYGISLKYLLFKKPKVYISLGHSYLDYDYKSPLYYTPYERILNGGSISANYTIKRFYVYSELAYNFGRETYYEETNNGQGQGQGQSGNFEKHYLDDMNTWSASIEAGYSLKKISFSIGGFHFENPFYKSSNVFLSIKGNF